MGKIIGFCGRCRSGKTELAKICEKKGYEKLYFALPLKQLCAEILNITINELNEKKNNNTKINLTIEKDICNTLSIKTNIPLKVTEELCYGKHIDNIRNMLQFIGTDYIRRYNKDWHVMKIKEMIDSNKNYVFDDVRFPNEKKMIESLGGDCWFLIRTSIENVSNHESETSLTWRDCGNKIIINNSTLDELLFNWNLFFDDYEDSCTARDKEFNRILENGAKDKIEPFSVLSILMLSSYLFTYEPKDIDKNSVKEIYMNNDKSIFVKYKDDTLELIDNPLLIEDIKMLL